MISYAAISIPEPFTILGLRLSPFCLGHYILLSKCGCAFVGEGDVEVQISDLLIGLIICSQTYEDGLSFVRELEQATDKDKIYIQINGRTEEWSGLITERLKSEEGFNVYTHIKAFARYIKEGSRQPHYFFKDDPSDETSGGHWSQNIVLTLKSDLGYSHSEAMNLPLCQAFHDYIKHCERNGAVSMAADWEEEQMRALGIE